MTTGRDVDVYRDYHVDRWYTNKSGRSKGKLVDPWDTKFTADDLPDILQRGTRAGQPPWNKGRRLPAEVYTAEEVALLISAWDPEVATGARNRAMIGLFYGCGLRLNEALSVRPTDIDLRYGAVRVLFAKHDLSRTVGIDQTSAALVSNWMDMHYDLGFIPGTPLLCSKYGTKLGKSSVYETLRRAARSVGLNRRIHPHGFRHSMAYALAMDGVPIPIIQGQLGHVNIGTTAAYLEHIAPRDVISAIARRSW